MTHPGSYSPHIARTCNLDAHNLFPASPCSCSLSYTLSLYHTPSIAPTHTHAFSHSYSDSLTLSLSLSHALSRKVSLSLSHSLSRQASTGPNAETVATTLGSPNLSNQPRNPPPPRSKSCSPHPRPGKGIFLSKSVMRHYYSTGSNYNTTGS